MFHRIFKSLYAIVQFNHYIKLFVISLYSILETFWDGKMLMGKIKLFTSPGWRKMGIVSTKGDQAAMLIMNGATLGISSRGVGSLKQIKGENVV